MAAGIIKHELALDFIFGGKSYVTFLNIETEKRFTFKVTKSKNGDAFFVSVLTSPDVYTFIGTCFNKWFKYSQKSDIGESAQSVKVFKYVIDKLKENTLSNLVEIYHDGRCGRCARQLTVPESILSGFGPECMKKMGKAGKRNTRIEQILG